MAAGVDGRAPGAFARLYCRRTGRRGTERLKTVANALGEIVPGEEQGE